MGKLRRRLPAVLEILRETSKDSPITIKNLVKRLERKGIKVGRTSLYRDVRAIQDSGWDLVQGKKGWYLAGERNLPPDFANLIIAAVQSSSWIDMEQKEKISAKVRKLSKNKSGVNICRMGAKRKSDEIHLAQENIIEFSEAIKDGTLVKLTRGEECIIGTPMRIIFFGDEYIMIVRGPDGKAQRLSAIGYTVERSYPDDAEGN